MRAAHMLVFRLCLLTTGAILRGFAPQGRLVAPMGVKFGVEKSTQDRAFMPNMTSGEVAWRWFGCPQNCKFYEILEYKCSAAAYPFNPLSNFHKRFMVRLVPYRESRWELALWVSEFWDLTLEVHFTQIFPGTYRRNFTSDAEWSKTPDLLHPHFKFGEGRTLHAAGGRKSSMFFLPASIARISSASDGI